MSKAKKAVAAVRRDREDDEEGDGLGHIIEVTIGDPYDLSRGHTRKYHYLSNMPAYEITRKYRAAVTSKKLPFDFQDDVAHRFDESTITRAQLQQLRQAGIQIDSEIFCGEEEKARDPIRFYAPKEIYLELWFLVMEFATDKKLKVKEVNFDEIHAGGYGLFSP